MNNAPRLYQLQLIDLDIESRRDVVKSIEERFGESDELITAKNEVLEETKLIEELEKKLRNFEWEAEDLRSKIKPLEDKLYGGSVRVPKELSSLQQEVDFLKKHLHDLEDSELDTMGENEDHRQLLSSKEENLVSVEKQWKQEQADLEAQRDVLLKEIETLEARRAAQAATIPAGDLSIYETLRTRKAGKAVAKIERGTCQGCRIAMPTTDIQRVRTSEKLVYCSSCGRILFLS